MATKPPVVDRETLYREVWTSPVTDVAPRYGLSDVGLVKICHKLAIPVPSRGYWAKVRAGRVMKIPPLPIVKENAREDTGLRLLSEDQVAARAVVKSVVKAVRASRRKTTSSAEDTPPETPERLRLLLKAARARLRQTSGWDEQTGIRTAPKEVLDIAVTRRCLDRAIDVMGTVLEALVPLGFDVRVNQSAGVTELVQDGTVMPLRIWEKVDRKRHVITAAEQRKRKEYFSAVNRGVRLPYPSLPDVDFVPTRRLTLSFGHPNGRNWNDTQNTQLETRIEEIVGGIISCIETYRVEQAEKARREAAYQEARARYQAEAHRRQEERRKLGQLRRDAARHWRATRLREYIQAFEAKASEQGEPASEALEWITWARAKADWIDPLTGVTDPILDAPEPETPRYWNY